MTENKVLTRDEILQADDLPREFVHVPEWSNGNPGAGVYVRTMTGHERDRFEVSITSDGKTHNFDNIRARAAASTMVDADGKSIFTWIDVRALGEKNASALDRVWEVAKRLNGLSDADVEELAKNSGGALGGASSSGSQNTSVKPSSKSSTKRMQANLLSGKRGNR